APGAPQTGNEFTDAITLPTDRQIRNRLQAAQEDYIKNEAWSEASSLLQSILNKEDDVFVPVKRKGPGGQELTQMVSARAEADRLVGTMPANGLQFYEVRYGGEARQLLDKARKE